MVIVDILAPPITKKPHLRFSKTSETLHSTWRNPCVIRFIEIQYVWKWSWEWYVTISHHSFISQKSEFSWNLPQHPRFSPHVDEIPNLGKNSPKVGTLSSSLLRLAEYSWLVWHHVHYATQMRCILRIAPIHCMCGNCYRVITVCDVCCCFQQQNQQCEAMCTCCLSSYRKSFWLLCLVWWKWDLVHEV